MTVSVLAVASYPLAAPPPVLVPTFLSAQSPCLRCSCLPWSFGSAVTPPASRRSKNPSTCRCVRRARRLRSISVDESYMHRICVATRMHRLAGHRVLGHFRRAACQGGIACLPLAARSLQLMNSSHSQSTTSRNTPLEAESRAHPLRFCSAPTRDSKLAPC